MKTMKKTTPRPPIHQYALLKQAFKDSHLTPHKIKAFKNGGVKSSVTLALLSLSIAVFLGDVYRHNGGFDAIETTLSIIACLLAFISFSIHYLECLEKYKTGILFHEMATINSLGSPRRPFLGLRFVIFLKNVSERNLMENQSIRKISEMIKIWDFFVNQEIASVEKKRDRNGPISLSILLAVSVPFLNAAVSPEKTWKAPFILLTILLLGCAVIITFTFILTDSFNEETELKKFRCFINWLRPK